MKRIYLLILALFSFSSIVSAQNSKTDTLPYQKDPNMPPFYIMKLDSATLFNTASIPEGRPTLLFFFGADCDHCQKALDHLLAGWDSLNHIDFYLMSFSQITPIKAFYDKNHLEKYPNIKLVGWDRQFFFSAYYSVHQVPGLALYDKNKHFLKLFDGHVTVKEIWEESKRTAKVKKKR